MQTFGHCSESTLWRLVCDTLCQPLHYSALTWRTIPSTGDTGFKVIRLLTWLWSFTLVFSVKESIAMCFSHARGANWENIRIYLTLGATKSASIVRVVSPKECNLFESSMLSSSSIFVSLLMLQRSCNWTQTLFIRWLWTYTKPKYHNLTKFSHKRCIGGYINFNKFCLPLVVSEILHVSWN